MRFTLPLFAVGVLSSALAHAAIDPQYRYVTSLPSSKDTLVLPLSSADVKAGTLPLLQDPSLRQQLQAAAFNGKAGAITTLYSAAGYERVVLLGLGDQSKLTASQWANYGGDVAAQLDKL